MNEIETTLLIDPDQLDKEWVHQPHRFMEVAERSAVANKEKTEAKNQLDITRAEMDCKIRTDPEKFGIEKPTEKAIESGVILSTEFQEAQKNSQELCYQAELISLELRAYEHRKEALSNLVQLWTKSYYAEPRVEPIEATKLAQPVRTKQEGRQRTGLNKEK